MILIFIIQTDKVKGRSVNRLYMGLVFCLVAGFLFGEEIPVSKPSVGLIIKKQFRGEKEFAERLKIASDRLGWKMHVIEEAPWFAKKKRFDWVLTLVPEKVPLLNEEKYLVLFDPENHFFNPDGLLKPAYKNYAGYLATYENTDLLVKDLGVDSNKVYTKQWYPSVQYRPYKEVNPTRLFYIIGHWGDRLKNQRYIELQEALSKTSYTNFFGSPKKGAQYKNVFKGDIDFDGKSVIDTISNMGVCLVLHSETHLKHKIPSGRIFEAAAASAVIISDMNPFVQKHFKDTVLYVNQELSGQEMAKQIDDHMMWIQSHPKEALDMAKRSHQVFEDNFILENQLLDLEKFIKTNSSIL